MLLGFENSLYFFFNNLSPFPPFLAITHLNFILVKNKKISIIFIKFLRFLAENTHPYTQT